MKEKEIEEPPKPKVEKPKKKKKKVVYVSSDDSSSEEEIVYKKKKSKLSCQVSGKTTFNVLVTRRMMPRRTLKFTPCIICPIQLPRTLVIIKDEVSTM